ncbi:hypothetical protein [Alicyclobacillus shizuokensis]|uniref:hypothetical protein n=1 Tax=Alicyclobacillus shizuokensis TaxID=392014 RepID=UPI000829A2AD|nr:hypothetical protein [Alicyclobacillus shizuokensis]
MDIRQADLILVRGHGPIERIIEHVTDSPYCHVAGLVKDNELIEAQAGHKIGYQALDYYDGVSDVFTCDMATEEQRQQIVEWVVNRLGGHYDYLLIGWEALHYILHVDLPYNPDPNRFDCSQLWSEAYRSVGIDLCPGIKFPSPADTANSPVLRKVGSF